MEELNLLIQFGIKLKEKIFLLSSYQILWLLELLLILQENVIDY